MRIFPSVSVSYSLQQGEKLHKQRVEAGIKQGRSRGALRRLSYKRC